MASHAGIDWAKDAHAVRVHDDEGQVLLEASFAHDQAGIEELCRALRGLEVVRVAIERPHGVLVERLLEAGLVVLAIHPNQVVAARERFRAAAGKSDRFDAMVLAELARTDHHRFRALVALSDETAALRALTRAREDLAGTRVGLANQLRALLEGFWAGAADLFDQLDSPIALAFLERYPAPHDTQGLGEQRLAGFLARNGYSGRTPAATLLARLRAAPLGRAGERESEAKRNLVLGLVGVLGPLVEQIRLISSQIAQAVRAHPDGPVFLSLFRSPHSTITAARLVAEIGDERSRYPTDQALAADAGMCPVAKQSGRSSTAVFRWACDMRLRDAVATLAAATRRHHPWARTVYARARERGCRHEHAIRILGRAWLLVIWRMWQNRQPYDPERHGNLQRLLGASGSPAPAGSAAGA